MSDRSRCKYCDQWVEWIEWTNPLTSEVKRIPIDPSAPTYDCDLEGIWRRSSAHVAHPATCKKFPQRDPGPSLDPLSRRPYKED